MGRWARNKPSSYWKHIENSYFFQNQEVLPNIYLFQVPFWSTCTARKALLSKHGLCNPSLGNSPPSVPLHRQPSVMYLAQTLLATPKYRFPLVKNKARWTTIKAFLWHLTKFSFFFFSLPSAYEQLCLKQLVSLSLKSLGGYLCHCFSFLPFSNRTQLQNWGCQIRSKFLFWPFSTCQPLKSCTYTWSTPQVPCNQECVIDVCPTPAHTVWHFRMQNL